MLSIVTLTMNPAVDESTSVPYVLPDRKLRCQAPAYEPGGGGINVARAIRKLGGDALACFRNREKSGSTLPHSKARATRGDRAGSSPCGKQCRRRW